LREVSNNKEYISLGADFLFDKAPLGKEEPDHQDYWADVDQRRFWLCMNIRMVLALQESPSSNTGIDVSSDLCC